MEVMPYVDILFGNETVSDAGRVIGPLKCRYCLWLNFFSHLVFDRLQPIAEISLQKPHSYHHTDGYLNTYVGCERPDKPTGSTDGKLTLETQNISN